MCTFLNCTSSMSGLPLFKLIFLLYHRIRAQLLWSSGSFQATHFAWESLDHRQAGPEPAFVYSKATLLYLLQSWVWHCLPGISRDLPDVSSGNLSCSITFAWSDLIWPWRIETFSVLRAQHPRDVGIAMFRVQSLKVFSDEFSSEDSFSALFL